MFLLTVLLVVQMQVKMFLVIGSWAEDALAASNLASAVIDVREYGMTQKIIIADPDEAYQVYQQALRNNLNLNTNWENANQDLIAGKVEILQYIIYNVDGRDIDIYSYEPTGQKVERILQGLGRVYAPDGCLIESSSVYSRIRFPLKGILGMELTAEKEKTVDVVRNGM